MGEYDPFEISKIRTAWEEAGCPPCDHKIRSENIPGIGRCDFYCEGCGASDPDRAELLARLGLA